MRESSVVSRGYRYSTILGTKRRLTASVALILISFDPLSAFANDWIGPANGDFFLNGNWSDSAGPQGGTSTFASGSANGTIDLANPINSSLARIIGTGPGNDASVVINLQTQGSNPGSLDLGAGSGPFLLGSNGANGALTLVLDGPAQIGMSAESYIIGQNAGSSGVLNLIGTGKETGVPPEGPLELGYSCYSCAPMFNASNGPIIIGSEEGTGTVNVQGASLGIGVYGLTIGDGAGSNGTLNVLAGGKLGDNYTGVGATVVIGNNGGTGHLNVDGTAAANRNEAPIALLNRGFTIGNGAGSIGSANILSQGKVHSFINYNLANDPSLTREELDTRIGVNGGSGLISVSGSGSVWYQSGAAQSYIGGAGTVVTDPGVLRVGQSGYGEVSIANQGLVRIGSASILGQDLYDGVRYRNVYELQDHISTGTLILGAESSGTGVLSIGGAQGQSAMAPGRLMAKAVQFGDGAGLIRFNHTDMNYVFDTFSDDFFGTSHGDVNIDLIGSGTIEAAAGRTLLNNDHPEFTGILQPSSGILQVNGDISTASANVLSGGVLEGVGIVGDTNNAGIIAPGRTPTGTQGKLDSIGTLTVAGNYNGANGIVAVDAVLGDDSSLTDMLVVDGNTVGSGRVKVTNVDGPGALTNEGIKIIDVGGTSAALFTLLGDYSYEGQQAVVGGAYAYRLYQGGVSTPADGDWYLRSVLKPIEPGPEPGPEPEPEPLYQAGVPTYEAYPQFLLGLNGLPTLQQRVGNRYWSNSGNVMLSEGADPVGSPYAPAEEAGVSIENNGIWGRLEGAHSKFEPRFSRSDTDYSFDTFRMQAGIDGLFTENESGKLIGSLSVHYVHGKAKTRSIHGDGEISTDGYGMGTSLTWYGNNGFYVDGQAQATWYDSDLNSTLANLGLTDGNDGFGYALSLESGKRIALSENWSVTPQAQLVYSNVDFDSFSDVFGAEVRSDRGDSLQGRVGLSFERQNSWYNAKGLINRTHLYGTGNLYYEFLDGTKVDVAGTSFASRNERLWGGVGFGGSYNWDNDKYSIYGEGSINTSLAEFGDNYTYKGGVGFRVKW